MTIAFDEVQFPADISAGVTGGAEFSTDVVIVSNGDEQANQNWEDAKGSWDVSTGVKKKSQADALIAFFRARKGKARRFRFKDWTDFAAIAQTMSPGTVLKLTATDFTAAAVDHSFTSAIPHPELAPLVAGDSIYISGTASNNGVKTVVSMIGNKLTIVQAVINEAAGATLVLLRLGPYQLQKKYIDAGNTDTRTITKPVAAKTVVYFAGVAHPTWWTIDLTTGIVTLVGGTAAPTYGQALTADFEFDIPARFDTDKAAFTIVDPGDGTGPFVNWQKVPVVEVRLC